MKSSTPFARFWLVAGLLLALGGCRKPDSTAETQAPTVTDIDGHVYRTVRIGNQVWMAENLRVTRYRNGDPISNLPDEASWGKTTEGAFCHYNNDSTLAPTYGRLYNWFAVQDPRQLAPKGWHVPSPEELAMLTASLAGDTIAGAKMRAGTTEAWLAAAADAQTESGFAALPGGYRYTPGGTFHTLGSNGYWWTTIDSYQVYAWSPRLWTGFANVVRDPRYQTYGFAVRCVKD